MYLCVEGGGVSSGMKLKVYYTRQQHVSMFHCQTITNRTECSHLALQACYVHYNNWRARPWVRRGTHHSVHVQVGQQLAIGLVQRA
jgi:hypothetical protein